MKFDSFCRTHYSYGALAPTLSLVCGYLSIDSMQFGDIIEKVELEVYFRSTTLPREDFASAFEDYNDFLDTLPKCRFERKRTRLKVEYETQLLSAEAVSDPPPMNFVYSYPKAYEVDEIPKPELFKPFLEESIEQIKAAFTKRIKPVDGFDKKHFFEWLSKKVPTEPVTQELIDTIQEQVSQWYVATSKPLDEWELLDIDWDQFHPEAKAILNDPFYWSPINDYSPHGNDTGHDVLHEYKSWRKRNPKSKEERFVNKLLSIWGMSDACRNHKELGVIFDEVFIALAFAQIKLEGTCSKWSGTEALDAVANRLLMDRNQGKEHLVKLQNKLLSFVPDYQFPNI